MKNYWLNRKPAGFPQDDEFSLQQLCGDCTSLDIFYAQQYFQNEKLELYSEAGGVAMYGPTLRVPICNLTCTGSIYAEGMLAATFRPEKDGYVCDVAYWRVHGLFVDNETGLVTVHWMIPPRTSHIMMNYEVPLVDF